MAHENIDALIANALDKKSAVAIENFNEVEYYSRDLKIDTGNLTLNFMCSGDCNGGLLAGQMISLEGKSYTGKTLTALHFMKGGVEAGAYVLVADAERTYTPDAMAQFGIPNGAVKMIEGAQQLETFFEAVYSILMTVPEEAPNTPIMIIVDSLSALVTRHLQEVGLEKVDMQKAKQISAGLNLIQSALSRHPNIYFIMVNQTYDTMETNKYATEEQKNKAKGGSAIEYYPGTRFRFTVAKRVLRDEKDKKSPVVGAWIRVESIKNRFNNPYIKAELLTLFGEGYDRYSGLFTLAFNNSLIDQVKSGWYNFKANPLPSNFRKNDFEKMCKEDNSLLERFKELSIKAKVVHADECYSIPDAFDDSNESSMGVLSEEATKPQAAEALQKSVSTIQGDLDFSV